MQIAAMDVDVGGAETRFARGVEWQLEQDFARVPLAADGGLNIDAGDVRREHRDEKPHGFIAIFDARQESLKMLANEEKFEEKQ